MHKGFLKTAAFLGALSVALGAFGAHGLKNIWMLMHWPSLKQPLSTSSIMCLPYWQQVFLYASYPSVKMKWAGYLFITGMILFSCSLYLLCYVKFARMNDMEWIGAITPFGGAAFIGGWGMLFLGLIKRN